jgi:hypothetical protein
VGGLFTRDVLFRLSDKWVIIILQEDGVIYVNIVDF